MPYFLTTNLTNATVWQGLAFLPVAVWGLRSFSVVLWCRALVLEDFGAPGVGGVGPVDEELLLHGFGADSRLLSVPPVLVQTVDFAPCFRYSARASVQSFDAGIEVRCRTTQVAEYTASGVSILVALVDFGEVVSGYTVSFLVAPADFGSRSLSLRGLVSRSRSWILTANAVWWGFSCGDVKRGVWTRLQTALASVDLRRAVSVCSVSGLDLGFSGGSRRRCLVEIHLW